MYIDNHFAITLPRIMDALYDIRSHKFENWYELFTGCKVLQGPNWNGITVLCKYDHGS